MNTPYFNPGHISFRKELKTFFSDFVTPYIDQWEKDRRIPNEIWKIMGAKGYFGLHHPESLGGSNRDFFYSVILLEELGYLGYAGFRGAISVHAYMATDYLARIGSSELAKKYLHEAIAGNKIAALALTEKNAGSDVGAIETTATIENDHFIINGSKIFITNGLYGDFYVMAVKIQDGKPKKPGFAKKISLLIVDVDTEGIEKKPMEKMGWHCSDTAELSLTNVKVPIENLIGKKDCGLFYIMKCFQQERLAAAILSLGGIYRCLDITKDYINKRKALGGGTVASYQAIRHRYADMISELEAVKQLAYHTAYLFDNGGTPIKECSMTKLRVTELANKVADECLQFHGGYGYLADHEISRIFRDTRLATIVGGTSEIMREIIAQNSLDVKDF